MGELTAKTAFADTLPVILGGLSCVETDLGRLTSVAPFAGQAPAVSKVLQSAHGLTFPMSNRATGAAGTRAIWFGRQAALLAGPAPAPGLSTLAALTDQTDAWAAATLSGPGAEDVLARLVPVDLRRAHFGEGHTVRSMLGHMNASVTRTGADSFLILVFRSMAGNLAHEVKEAMAAVVARG